MSIFNKAIGGFDALIAQARSYKMFDAANAAKRIAYDVASRSGGVFRAGSKMGTTARYAIAGGVIGGAYGGTRSYYSGEGFDGMIGGTIRGAFYGAGAGAGLALGRGVYRSARGGVIGEYAGMARSAMSSRMSAARAANRAAGAQMSFNFV